MLYVRPNYYEKFKCTADRCEATCCAGWQIVIDETSLARYITERGEYGEVLRGRIDWEEGVFKQDCRNRCAFLKADNLCDMYEQLGEESLCFTCMNYPRHIEEFEDLREITLAISCPEVAKVILGQKEPVRFVEEEIEENEIEENESENDADEVFGMDEEEVEPCEDDFDPFYFSYLEDARKIMLSILQDRSLSVAVRTALVQKMAEEMQEIIEEGNLFDLADVFDKYEATEDQPREKETNADLTNAVRETESALRVFYENTEEYFRYAKAVFERLYELEHLSEIWEDYLEQCGKTLFGAGPENYQEICRKFQTYCTRELFGDVEMEIILEQLLVYFVFTYFCGAVYDDNVIGKVRMAVDSVHIIYQMCMAKWAEQNESLSAKDIRQIVYRYSRELEHSDVNLELMENARMEKLRCVD